LLAPTAAKLTDGGGIGCSALHLFSISDHQNRRTGSEQMRNMLSTAAPYHVNNFVLGPAVTNTHTTTILALEPGPQGRRSCRPGPVSFEGHAVEGLSQQVMHDPVLYPAPALGSREHAGARAV
jgi:hypothetical protein